MDGVVNMQVALYEADVKRLKQTYGDHWHEYVRGIIHGYFVRLDSEQRRQTSPGDLDLDAS